MRKKIGQIFIVLFLSLVAYIYLLYKNIISFPDAIPISISVVALFVSIISVFKSELFPYDLLVFIDDFYLITGGSFKSKNQKTIQPMPTLTFYNRGYGECPLRNIQMIVIPQKRNIKYVLIPTVEVDTEDLIRQNKGINTSNMKNMFCGFLLEPKKSTAKTIIFTPESSEKTPAFYWEEDKYLFEIFIQIHGEEKNRKFCEKEIEISNNILFMLLHGMDVLNIMDK